MPIYLNGLQIADVNIGISSSSTPTLQDKTVTPTTSQQIVKADSGYDGLNQVTVEAIKNQDKSVSPTESTQNVKPDSGYDGLSSVSVGAISSTYVGSGITKKTAQTYTPTTSNQTISAGQYLSGAQTIQGDTDLVAENIKAGVNIFNVTGTFTSDATASASDILSSKTAYVNGSKITGTVVYQDYYSGSSAPSSSLGNNGDLYFQTG